MLGDFGLGINRSEVKKSLPALVSCSHQGLCMWYETSSSACRSALKRNNTGGNLIDAAQHPVGVNRFQSSFSAEPDTDRFTSSTTSAARDSPSASSGLLSVTSRQANDAETQTPPSVRDFRRSMIDNSNRLFPTAGGRPDEVPLDVMTACVQSASVNEESNQNRDDRRGTSYHDELLAANLNVGDTEIIRKSTDKKTNKLSNSLLVRGRHAYSTEKKEPPSQTTKTKAQDGDLMPSRSSIFVLLGLTD